MLATVILTTDNKMGIITGKPNNASMVDALLVFAAREAIKVNAVAKAIDPANTPLMNIVNCTTGLPRTSASILKVSSPMAMR